MTLQLLLSAIIKYIAEFVDSMTEDLFDIVKTELLKFYFSSLFDPATLARYITLIVNLS